MPIPVYITHHVEKFSAISRQYRAPSIWLQLLQFQLQCLQLLQMQLIELHKWIS